MSEDASQKFPGPLNAHPIPPELGVNQDLAWRVGTLMRLWQERRGDNMRETLPWKQFTDVRKVQEDTVRTLLSHSPEEAGTQQLFNAVASETDPKTRIMKFQSALEKHFDITCGSFFKENNVPIATIRFVMCKDVLESEMMYKKTHGISITGFLK